MTVSRFEVLASFLILAYLIGLSETKGHALPSSHPRLFFDQAGMEELRERVLTNSRLNKIWLQFKTERVDSALRVNVTDAGFDDVWLGREYGDALGDLTVAYIVLREPIYALKAKEIIRALTKRPTWGSRFIKAHISIGLAFCWDVLYDQFTNSERNAIMQAVQANGDNNIHRNVYGNASWTSAAGMGLLSMAFQGDGSAAFDDFLANMLDVAKENYKEKSRSVLWAHSTDGFPHEGLGYWRKYNHVGLFLTALRQQEPDNDWFHLGANYPGSEFLKNAAYARIYAEVDHAEIASLTWADATQVRGKYGNIGVLSLVASEYKDGYALDFIDYLIDERGFDFDGEDWATFLFYDDEGIPAKSFRDLPLSRYWPDAEAAIFRSGWQREDLIFYMKCGSPGGHARRLKRLVQGDHEHPDANGFVLFFDNDYLAAEDGYRPFLGSYAGTGQKITSGHNTFLIDGEGQKGSGTKHAGTTNASMDFLDSEFMGYLLGDATDAYAAIDKYYRTVLYRKHKYFVILDELKDNHSHKYEFLLGADDKHRIESLARNQFQVTPITGSAKLVIDFVEPRSTSSSITQDRIYSVTKEYTDMLRVSPSHNTSKATFLSLLYPLDIIDVEPSYSRIIDEDRSGFIVDGNEYYLYNGTGALYTYETVTTDARLCYFKNSAADFEFLVAGAKEFVFEDKGISATKPVVAAFSGTSGKLRLGKNLAGGGITTITIHYPETDAVLVDGEAVALTANDSGSVQFDLAPKTFKIGPPGYEQTVTGNYEILISTRRSLQVISPNGGEVWQSSKSQSILWSSSVSFPQVKLEFSGDKGRSWQTIADATANDGIFAWTIPDTISTRCLIRISSVESGFLEDVNDETFSIVRELAMPIISEFDPSSGQAGALVTIAGRHFSGTMGVRFNDLAALYSVESDSVILATVPESALTGRITVATVVGSSMSADVFVVELPPAIPEITGFKPTQGTLGTNVTINGHHFSGAQAINFNGVSATFSVESDSTIFVTLPDSATTGHIVVRNKNGTATSTEEFVVLSNESMVLTYKATDDAYVWSRKPGANRGESKELRVRNAQEEQITYFKFSVQGIKGTVVSAKLRVMVTDGTNGPSMVYSASNSYRGNDVSWDEFGLTWLNAPETSGPPLSTLGALEIGELAEYNVSASIAEDGEYTFALRTPENDVLKVSSNEGIRAPELEIEVQYFLPSARTVGSTHPLPGRQKFVGSPPPVLLQSNYPNPFNPSTTIAFALQKSCDVRLKIYNLRGRLVESLQDGPMSAGEHRMTWDGRDAEGQQVAAGIYIYRLEADDFVAMKKMTLMK